MRVKKSELQPGDIVNVSSEGKGFNYLVIMDKDELRLVYLYTSMVREAGHSLETTQTPLSNYKHNTAFNVVAKIDGWDLNEWVDSQL